MKIVEIVENDKKFMQIQELIQAKRNMLLKKQKNLEKITQQNAFLDDVKNDYLKYYNYINQQKQQQIQAFEILNTYIKDLTETGNLTKYNIEDATYEQEKILREVNSIKKNINSIIENTSDLSIE
jgi:cell division septum initiation protein DivIVA